MADWHIHVVATEPLQYLDRVAAFEGEFGKSRLVEHGDPFAGCVMFGGVIVEPVLASEAVFNGRRFNKAHSVDARMRWAEAWTSEPVGALPTLLDPEASALRREALVQWTLPQVAASLKLPVWPGHLIVQPERFGHALAQK